MGFDDNGIDWTITGGNGFDAITGTDLTNANPFPTAKEIDESDDVIDGSASYTISHVGAIDNADSIYFSIYGPDATVLKRMGAGTTSASISASEMSSLGKGNAIIQIAAFNIHSGEASGKKLYMGKRGRSFKNRNHRITARSQNQQASSFFGGAFFMTRIRGGIMTNYPF